MSRMDKFAASLLIVRQAASTMMTSGYPFDLI